MIKVKTLLLVPVFIVSFYFTMSSAYPFPATPGFENCEISEGKLKTPEEIISIRNYKRGGKNQSPYVVYLLGIASMQLGRYGDAIDYYTESMDIMTVLISEGIFGAPDIETVGYRGWCYYKKGQYANAQNDFKVVFSLKDHKKYVGLTERNHSMQGLAHYGMSKIYYEQKRLKEAYQELVKAANFDEEYQGELDNAKAWYNPE